MKYKLYIIFFVIIGLGVTAIYFVSVGYYPIAVVNGDIITANTFINNYDTASVYYRNFLKTYGSALSTGSGQASSSQIETNSSTLQILTPSQIQKSVLAGLIENILIEKGARKEMGKELDRLVGEKVSQAVEVPEIEKAVWTIYGLSLNDFKREVLVPQAERDILTGSLFLKGQKIEDWLSAEKKSSNIVILSRKFYWNGEDVQSH
ncbi:MAG: hypothetical protein Q7K44_03080 [Candidatus Liptonbacteria bacterium]|nr:hypothetical protein [Candidatus Liptonbacteria bacterium]